jgi:LEA14-like dessication related protein
MADGKNKALVWVGAGVTGLYLLYRFIRPRVIEPKQLQAYSQRVRIYMPTVRFKGDQVNFDLYVQNPNSDALLIRAIVGEVYMINGANGQATKIGHIARYGDTVIKPLSETKFELSVRIKFIQLLGTFNNILAGKVAGITIAFQGTININNRPWPIKEKARIS